MKLLKGFILALIGLFLLITLVSLLMPSRIMTARSVVIHADEKKIIAEIADLQNWKHWHPLFKNDSSAIKFSNPSAGINAFATWTSNEKTNKLLINAILVNQVNAILMRTGENDIAYIIAVTKTKDIASEQVEWKAMTKLKWYPWEKFSGIFVDKMTGPGYEAALNELKEFCEGERN